MPDLFDEAAESDIGAIIEMVRALRNLRAEFRIQPRQAVEAVVDAPEVADVVEAEAAAIKTLAQVEPLTLASGGPGDGEPDQSVSLVLGKGTVTVPLGGLVDLDVEKKRLRDELAQVEASSERLSRRLDDKQFVAKAPEEVVERERERLEGWRERRERIVETLSRLG
jgi:valyl-tRNA synthetase